MYCNKCGKQLEASAKFCDGCGAINEKNAVGSNVNENKNNQLTALIQNKKIVLGVLVVVVILIIGSIFINKNNINNSPVGVAKALFTAMDKQDADTFLKCIGPEAVEELKDYSDNYMRDLKDQLTYMDETFEEEYGKNWSKKIKYKAVGSREVEVTMDGESEVLEVYKIDGKYYIVPDGLF